jgi:hypothetical protein
MDAPLTRETAIILAVVLALAVGTVSFLWPANAYRRSAWAVAVAMAGPFVVGLLINPFLGSGAGLGVVLILGFFVAAILIGAGAAVVGATARHVWDRWRRAEK